MSRVKHLISSLSELYKKLFQESTEQKEVDFLLDALEEDAELNRKKLSNLGFWTEED